MRQSLNLIHGHPHFKRVLEVLETLKTHGEEGVLAGGCVRDALLGVSPHDFDIATSAHPEKIEGLFAHTLAVGKAFGTIIVVYPEIQFEVTTFRTDGDYKDGRRPSSVEFSSPKEDALRRDFTINALFYDPLKEEIEDFVGGRGDLQRRLIRAVGDPVRRFGEDRLRMLRAVRFAAQLDFEIEPKTFAAVQSMASQITDVSQERIFQELSKLLKAKGRQRGLRLLQESGLAKIVWPELAQEEKRFKEWQRLLELVSSPSLAASLALWVLSTNEDALSFLLAQLQRWKAPVDLQRRVRELVEAHKTLWNPHSRPAQRLRTLGVAALEDLMDVEAALCQGRDGNLSRLQSWVEEYLKICDSLGDLPKPLLQGDELLKMGYVPGPYLGEILQPIYENQLEGKIRTIEQARELARKRLPQTNKPV